MNWLYRWLYHWPLVRLQPKSKGSHSKHSLETQVQKHRQNTLFQATNIIRSTQIGASYFRTHLRKEV